MSKSENNYEVKKISPTEALFGFCCWLSTQKKPTILACNFDSKPAQEAVSIFCKANNLPTTCQSYPGFQYPPDLECKSEKVSRQAPKLRPGRYYGEKALACLSGDLNHENVAKAKKILRELLSEKHA